MRRPALVLACCLGSAALLVAQGSASKTLPSMRLGMGERMPRVISQVMPIVPPDEAGARTVEIEAVVGINGAVLHARVSSPSEPAASFARASLEAVRGWRFRPATTSQGPVTSLVGLRFEVSPGAPDQAGRVSAAVFSLPQEPLPETLGALTVYEQGTRAARTATPTLVASQVIRNIMPDYSAEAMRAKLQGAVEIEIVILPDGTVGAARLVRSLDAATGLDRQALICARYWLFSPAMLDGKPVASSAHLVLEFRLH